MKYAVASASDLEKHSRGNGNLEDLWDLGFFLRVLVSGAFQNNRRRCLLTHGRCEAVAAERVRLRQGFRRRARGAMAGRTGAFPSRARGVVATARGYSKARSAPPTGAGGRGAVSRAVKPCRKRPQPSREPAWRIPHSACVYWQNACVHFSPLEFLAVARVCDSAISSFISHHS